MDLLLVNNQWLWLLGCQSIDWYPVEQAIIVLISIQTRKSNFSFAVLHPSTYDCLLNYKCLDFYKKYKFGQWMTAESWHWEFLIDSQWIPITWIERRLGSKRKSSISPTLTFCLLLSLSVYLPLLLSQLLTFCLSLPSCSCVPAAGATLAVPNSWGTTSVFSGCVATIDSDIKYKYRNKYKTKYDRNTPLSMPWRIW